MEVELPALLQVMIDDGRWSTPEGANDERISVVTARQWDPSAPGIHLLAEPVTLSSDLAAAPTLGDLWNTADVDPERCLVIADFGLGSDNPIVLDFADQPPSVRTLRWPVDRTGRSTWVTIAATFDEFVSELGLL
jgi:hypothetical protein